MEKDDKKELQAEAGKTIGSIGAYLIVIPLMILYIRGVLWFAKFLWSF